MSLRITGKHMDIGDSLRGNIEDRISAAVAKYFDGGFSGQVTIEKQGNMFQTDCTVRLDTGIALQATGKEHAPVASFEAAAERVEKRLRRYKRRLKDHHGQNSSQAGQDIAYTVMEAPSAEQEVPTDYNPVIVAEITKSVNTQTVAMAVMQLDLTDEPVHMFKNASNGAVNVVYRRNDGNIGWIDPSAAS